MATEEDLGDGHHVDYYSDFVGSHGLRDGVTENEYELDDPMPFPRTRFPPSQSNAMHANSDVDSSQQAQHHTLGPRHNQASPGDHTHNGVSSRALGVWSTYLVSWTCVGGTNPVLADGLLLGRYMQIGGTVFGRMTFAAGASTTFGSSQWAFSLPPVALAPVSGFAGNPYEGGVGVVLASNNYSGSPRQPNSSYRGVLSVDMWTNAIQIFSDNAFWSGTSPWTWSATSGFQASFMYEAKTLAP